jgi:DNA gyrase subunit B
LILFQSGKFVKNNILKTMDKKQGYSSGDISVLEGLDPIRKRPGMYIGSTGNDGLHHLIKECLDNSLDEAMGGHAKNIEIAVLSDDVVSITDDGRGIPIDIHEKTKKSGLETVMTTIHAGGKFGGKAYQASGGLHGVGVSVVCALSEWTRADVYRDGYHYYQEYKKGVPTTDLIKEEKSNKTGTVITFKPDIEIFKEVVFHPKKIMGHIRQQAYLTKGIKINFRDSRGEIDRRYSFYFEGGVASYVKYLTRGVTPIHSSIFYCTGVSEEVIVEAAFRYTQEYEVYEESFANNIITREGGTHLTGFRGALTKTINNYGRRQGILKENDENLKGEDIREGLTSVVSVKIREPQFEGQTKNKLGNLEARTAVDSLVSENLIDFFEKNPQEAKEIIGKCLLSAKARRAARAVRQNVLRKGVLDGLALPGKLSDCSTKKPEESEIYIIEGESAGGSCKSARDRRFQAILPLKGKILNVERSRLDRILESKEIKSLVIAMGAAIAEDFNIEKLRYHRIILMADADSDGNHIKTLLLTLFYRYFRPIIEKGYLYLARPPLYKIQIGKRVEYAYTEADKAEILSTMNAEKADIQRYKGLGEMNPSQLWETTMNPENRVLLQVNIDDAKDADKMFDTLMGQEVHPRKTFIKTHAKEASNIDI